MKMEIVLCMIFGKLHFLRRSSRGCSCSLIFPFHSFTVDIFHEGNPTGMTLRAIATCTPTA